MIPLDISLYNYKLSVIFLVECYMAIMITERPSLPYCLLKNLKFKLKFSSFKVITNSRFIMRAFPITCLCKHGEKKAQNFIKLISRRK